MIYLNMLSHSQPDECKAKLMRIYSIFKNKIYFLAFDILKDCHEAEDIVQTVMIKISKNITKIDEQELSKMASYIYIITKNCCHDVQRKKSNIDLIPADMMDQIYPNLITQNESYYEHIERSNELAIALNRINDQYAEIITLKYFHNLKIKEISDLLGISENNVSVRLHRAINELKKLMTLEVLNDEKTGAQ